MPVTARLSGKFYERLGDDVANELVNWFNAVDSTYQGQLKEINDLNCARMEARFDAFDARMNEFEARIVGWTPLSPAWKLSSRSSDPKCFFWMFAFWSATVIPLIGVMLALSGTFRR